MASERIYIYESTVMGSGRWFWDVLLCERLKDGGWGKIKTIKKFYFDHELYDDGVSKKRTRKQAELFAKRSRRARGIKEVDNG